MRVIPKRPEYDLKTVGANLRRLRKAKGLSVEEVREYLMIGSTQAIYKYENGKSYPQSDTMFALMELYGATIYDIIGRPATVSRTYEEDLEGSSSVIYGFVMQQAS
ncbi:MAG: helix-turn-helix domain-containing protein [Lachnospiraceae bacterium]|nr:helix-turn-helix domain-containing protein [Lachnospiraceae bacterium]